MSLDERSQEIVRVHMAAAKTPGARRIEEMFRVPVAESLWPQCVWIAAICYDESRADGSLLPWDAEVQQVASYIDFKLEDHYRESFVNRVRALPLPLCGGHNTVIFVKREDGWGYRRASWETGSWPHAYRGRVGCPAEPQSLVQILDRVEGSGHTPLGPHPKWVAWKEAHADVFEAVPV